MSLRTARNRRTQAQTFRFLMNLFDVYSLYDIEPVRGEGSYVFTADGTRYLDLYSLEEIVDG